MGGPWALLLWRAKTGRSFIRHLRAHLALSNLPPPFITTSYSGRKAALPTVPIADVCAKFSSPTKFRICAEGNFFSIYRLLDFDRCASRRGSAITRQTVAPKNSNLMPHSDLPTLRSKSRISFGAENLLNAPCKVHSVVTLRKSPGKHIRGILDHLAAIVAITIETVL